MVESGPFAIGRVIVERRPYLLRRRSDAHDRFRQLIVRQRPLVERFGHEAPQAVRPPGPDPGDFDRKAERVVQVHDATHRQVEGTPVGSGAEGTGTLKDLQEIALVARAVGDIEDALVADAVAGWPGLANRIEVLHDFDEDVGRADDRPPAARAGQTPQCLVLRCVQGDFLGRLAADRGQVGHRRLEIGRGHRDRAHRDRTVVALAGLSLRQGIVLHDLDVHAVGVAHAGAAPSAFSLNWRKWLGAETGEIGDRRIEIGHVHAHARETDVAGAEVGRHQLGDRSPELEQFELEPAIARDQPPAAGCRARQSLHAGRHRAGHQRDGSAGGQEPESFAKPLVGDAQVDHRKGDLAERRRAGR